MVDLTTEAHGWWADPRKLEEVAESSRGVGDQIASLASGRAPGHYIVSKSVLLTLYSVKKCLIDTI